VTSPDLTPTERRAIALAAQGLRCRDIRTQLGQEKLPVSYLGLGPVWFSAAQKMGFSPGEVSGRQPQLVYRAHTLGCLDLADPDDPGRLPLDILAMLRSLTEGHTLTEHAAITGMSQSQVEYLVRNTRRRLGDVSLAGLVHRALPQLLPAKNTEPLPGESLPVVESLQAELPGDLAAVGAGREWARSVCPCLGWKGPAPRAAEVTAHLVSNAVRHGLPNTVPPQCHLLLRAAVTDNGDLVLDVTDHNPRFPGFGHETWAGSGRGMRRLARLDVQLSWAPCPNGIGKTVRATLPDGRETG